MTQTTLVNHYQSFLVGTDDNGNQIDVADGSPIGIKMQPPEAVNNPSWTARNKNLFIPGTADTQIQQIIINGAFINGTTGWSCAGPSAISDGYVTLSADSVFGALYSFANVTKGIQYALIYTVLDSGTVGSGAFGIGGGATTEMITPNTPVDTSPGTHCVIFNCLITPANKAMLFNAENGATGLKMTNIMLVNMGASIDTNPVHNLSSDIMISLILKTGYWEGLKSFSIIAGGWYSAANILSNGDFSNGTTGWNNNGGTCTIETDSTFSHCLKIVATKSYDGVCQITSFNRHYWSVWVKADAPCSIMIGHESSSQKTVSVTTSWQRFSGYGDISTTGAFIAYSTGACIFYIADYFAADVGEDSTNPLFSLAQTTVESLVLQANPNAFWPGSKDIGGVTIITDPSDQSILFDGICLSHMSPGIGPTLLSATTWDSSKYIQTIIGKYYTIATTEIAGTKNHDSCLFGVFADGHYLTAFGDSSNSPAIFQSTGQKFNFVYANIDPAQSFSNYIFKIQFEQSDTPTIWEKALSETFAITASVSPNDLLSYDGTTARKNGIPVPHTGTLIAYQGGQIEAGGDYGAVEYTYNIDKDLIPEAQELKSYVPPFVTQSKIFNAVYDAQGSELQNLSDIAENIANQCFVDTATWGLKYWEQFLGIPVDESKETSYRRSAIKSKIRGSGTTTVALIQSVAQSYENGEVDIIEHPGNYSFDIKFVGTLGIPPNLDDLKAAIEEIKPAHLAVTYIFTFITWTDFDGFSKTWDAWDALGLTWDKFEVYKE